MAKKYLFWFVTSLLILITAYILTVTVILPVATSNPMPAATLPKSESKADSKSKKAENSAKKADKNGGKTDTKVSNNTATEESVSGSKDELLRLFELKKTETLLRSRYSLSTEDSIYLVLDLINRIARLEMKGVPLHDSKIDDVWISNSIRKFHADALIRWISQPFVLKNADATIIRVPFIVKIAPKDTIEANKNESLPSARKIEDFYIVMNFERNLQLVIQQSEKSEGEDKSRIDSLKNSYVKIETGRTIKALSTFKREAVVPKIVITLPKSEAVILYRALPQKPKMVLRM